MGSRAILVAEDDANDAFFLSQALVEAGVIVPIHFVDDGRAALDYLQGKAPYDDRVANPRPSLLILDLRMPVMSGFDVLDWRRHQADLWQIPVVVFSGLEAESQISRAYSLGAKRYMTKTHNPREWASLFKSLAEEYGLGVNAATLNVAATPNPVASTGFVGFSPAAANRV